MPRPATKTEALDLAHERAARAEQEAFGDPATAAVFARLSVYAATVALSLPDKVEVPLTAENFPDRVISDHVEDPITGPNGDLRDAPGANA